MARSTLMLTLLPVLLPTLLLGCTRDGGLTKFNSVPEAQITSPADGSPVREGQAVTLRGQASDPNHAASELLAQWFTGAPGAEVVACGRAAPAEDGATACDVTVPAGEALSVRLEVLDPEGAVGTAVANLPIVPDGDPTVEVTAPDGVGPYYADQLVTLRALVGDDVDPPDTLGLRWVSSLDGELAAPSTVTASGQVEAFARFSEGQHALQLLVTDSSGNEVVDSVVFEVGPPNSAPSCGITSPTSGTAGELGATVLLGAAVADPDVSADTLSVTWSSDRDGVLGTSTPTSGGDVVFPWAGLSRDVHVLTLRVEDALGATCTDAVVYTVGTPPALEVLTPAAGDTVNEGEPWTFTAEVSDAEDVPGDLRVRWETDLDGSLLDGPPDATGGSGLVEVLSVGEHVLTVTVTDTAGLMAVQRLPLSVNGLPTAPVVSLSPTVPYGDDDLVVSIDAPSVDPEGDRLTYGYTWYQNGVASAASTGATLPASATTRGETWRVEVWASDGGGESPVGSASVTIGDTSPVVSSVSVSPSVARTDDTLACIASGVADADGEIVSLAYTWSVDGATVGETGSTLAGSWFDRGDSVACAVVPTADSGTGSAMYSAAITILNTAPTLASASLTPAAPTRGSTLACAPVGASDADGDTVSVTYAWTLDGVAAGTSSTLAGPFAAGSVAECTVTPTDGTDAGTPASASVTVTNTAPVVSSVTLSPSTVRTNDTLSASVASSDADGDTVTLTYTWFVNGVRVAETGPSLSGTTWFDRDDTVEVEVTPSDADGAGVTVVSGAVTVANTAPSAPSIGISPGAPTAGDTLTCGVTGAATDADGDPLTYAMTWTLDGAPFAGATTATWSGDTVPGASVAWEDAWTCSAVASDGTDVSGTATATVTLACAPGSGSGCPALSCADVIDSGASSGDGLYWIDPLGTGAFRAYCDMTTDGGGWTLVVWIDAGSRAHANTTAAVGDPALRSGAAKYTDALISALNDGGYWRYRCGTYKHAYVRTASGAFSSMYTNAETWSLDDRRDGVFECAANRAGYVFSDYPACTSTHTDYGALDGTGCYMQGEGWGRAGSLWAR